MFAYVGAVIVESIPGGALSGALAERRRQRTIERLENHFDVLIGVGTPEEIRRLEELFAPKEAVAS